MKVRSSGSNAAGRDRQLLWPGACAQFLDFVAALRTTSMHQLRLLWSRQIEKSYDYCQSEAAVQLSRVAGSNAALHSAQL
jgi:hypothetical protein